MKPLVFCKVAFHTVNDCQVRQDTDLVVQTVSKGQGLFVVVRSRLTIAKMQARLPEGMVSAEGLQGVIVGSGKV
jgi:hypothetical protein